MLTKIIDFHPIAPFYKDNHLAFMYLVYSHPFGDLTGYLAFDIQLASNTSPF